MADTIELVTAYEPFTKPDKDGKWYQKWQIQKGMAMPGNYIPFGPDPSLRFPRFNFETGQWVEDEHALNTLLLQENEALKARVAQSEGAIMDLAAMVLSKKEEK